MSEDKDQTPFAHLSNDLDEGVLPAGPSEEVSLDAPLSAPDAPGEPGAVPLMTMSDTPTQIVRAHKALDRAREKRRQRIEEGRSLIIDRDKPPPPPPRKPIIWYALAIIAGVGLAAAIALIVHHLTMEDVVDEAIADEGDSESVQLEEEPLPPPVIHRAAEETPTPPKKVEEPPKKVEETPPPKKVVEETPPPKKIEEPPPPPKKVEETPPPPKKQVAVTKQKTSPPSKKSAKNEDRPSLATIETPPDLKVEEAPKQPEKLPPPVKEKKGWVTIRSSAAGAEVEVDAQVVGKLPLNRLELPAGRHSIWVTLKNYQVWQRDVMVRADQTTTLDVKLSPISPL